MGAVHGSPKPLRAAAAAANRILSAAEVIFVGAALAFASALLFAERCPALCLPGAHLLG